MRATLSEPHPSHCHLIPLVVVVTVMFVCTLGVYVQISIMLEIALTLRDDVDTALTAVSHVLCLSAIIAVCVSACVTER